MKNATQNTFEITKEKEFTFRTFFDESYDDGYGLITKLIDDETTALQLLQDAYIRVGKEFFYGEKPKECKEIIQSTVRTVAVEHLRKSAPAEFEQLYIDEVVSDEVEVSLPENETIFFPDFFFDYTALQQYMSGIINKLPKVQKLSTLLYYYEKVSLPEISKLLQCSENKVKEQLQNARKNIEQAFTAYENDTYKHNSIDAIPFLLWMFKNEDSTASHKQEVFLHTFMELKKYEKEDNEKRKGNRKPFILSIIILLLLLVIGGIIVGTKTQNQTQEEMQNDIPLQTKLSFDDLDAEFLKGMLTYAVLYPETDELICNQIENILLYKYIELEKPELISVEMANPLADEEVIITENEDQRGITCPVISCDLSAIEKIAKMYGYEKDIETLFASSLMPDYMWQEGSKVSYMVCNNISPDSSEVILGVSEVEGNIMRQQYVLKVRRQLGTTVEVEEYPRGAVIEITEQGFVITEVVTLDEEGYIIPTISDFGKKVIDQDPEVYKRFAENAEDFLTTVLENENIEDNTSYAYEIEYVEMFYFEDPETDEDSGKFINVVFSVTRRTPETDQVETFYAITTYYNHIYNGGWDAIKIRNIELDKNNQLIIPEGNSELDVSVVRCESDDYMNELLSNLEYYLPDNLTSPYYLEIESEK